MGTFNIDHPTFLQFSSIVCYTTGDTDYSL